MATLKKLREQQARKRAIKDKAKARKKAIRDKHQAKREAAKTRKAVRQERRANKRAIKAAPKKSLKQWSQEVLEHDNHRCVVCGAKEVQAIHSKTGKLKFMRRKVKNADGTTTKVITATPVMVRLNAHHILPKERYQGLRLEVVNGVTLCPQHHKYNKFSAHRNPIWFAVWLEGNRPHQYKWAVEHMGEVDV